MDILLSMKKPWPQYIFAGIKPFEFRNFNPKYMDADTRFYIYESKYGSGSGKVVGSFKTDGIIGIDLSGLVEKNFIEYYCREILRNNKFADKFAYALSVPMECYKPGITMHFALCDKSIEFIEKTGEWPKRFTEECSKSKSILKECSFWLYKIGFFNENYETNYKKAIIIKEPKEFISPLELSSFLDEDGHELTKAPQGWQYVKMKGVS